MMGVAEPPPGILTFHLTLLVSLHVTGGLASGATPLASGPRHWGQFASAPEGPAALVNSARTAAQSRKSAHLAPGRREAFGVRAACCRCRMFWRCRIFQGCWVGEARWGAAASCTHSRRFATFGCRPWKALLATIVRLIFGVPLFNDGTFYGSTVQSASGFLGL